MKSIGYYCGEAGELDSLRIPMQDRAMFFGDGVYDFVFGYNGKLFALADHVERFYRSMSRIEIRPYCDRETLYQEIERCMALADLQEGEGFQLYLQASRGNCPRNHIFPPKGTPSTLLITVSPLKKLNYSVPLKLVTVEDTRFLHCNIKTLNLIPNCVAAQRAEEAGCQEAVFHRGEQLTECAHSSLVIIKDQKVIGPVLDNLILPSITRKHVWQLCEKLGIETESRYVSMQEVYDADEVLVLSTSKLMARASEIDRKPAGMKDPETAEKIRDAYFAWVKEETGFWMGD